MKKREMKMRMRRDEYEDEERQREMKMRTKRDEDDDEERRGR